MNQKHPRQLLKDLRAKADVTQVEMASYLRIPKTTYSSYEQGHRDPEVTTAKNMATKLNISWTIFFENEVRESDYINSSIIAIKK